MHAAAQSSLRYERKHHHPHQDRETETMDPLDAGSDKLADLPWPSGCEWGRCRACRTGLAGVWLRNHSHTRSRQRLAAGTGRSVAPAAPAGPGCQSTASRNAGRLMEPVVREPPRSCDSSHGGVASFLVARRLGFQIVPLCNTYVIRPKRGVQGLAQGVSEATPKLASALVRKFDPGVVVRAEGQVDVMRWGFTGSSTRRSTTRGPSSWRAACRRRSLTHAAV